jgi:hypothetical protein
MQSNNISKSITYCETSGSTNALDDHDFIIDREHFPQGVFIKQIL